MEKEFLLGLDVTEEVAEAVLEQHGREVGQLREQLRQAQFDSRLGCAIAAAGGRNHKAIAALLDAQQLYDADDETIAQAVEQVKKDCDYLFCAPVAYAPGTGAVQEKQEKNSSLADALREKFGK